MRKRLRKKRRLGEFREYGFEVRFDITGASAWNDVFDAFIVEAIEGNGLQFGGSPRGGFVAAEGRRASATEAHRRAVRAWLERRPDVANIAIGELRDVWHGW